MTYRIIMYPQDITVRLKFSVHDNIYANCGAIVVTTSMTYMTIVEHFDEYSSPFSPEVIRSSLTSILNDINRKEHQSLPLRGIGSGPGPSPPPSCFLSWHGD